MVFTKPYTVAFFVVYTLTGISDLLDGTVARLTKTTSAFGAKLDSVADLFFYVAMFFMILPELRLQLPPWVWALYVVALLIRLIAYALAAVRFKKFAATHAILNKLSGFSVFLTPYLIKTPASVLYCIFVGVLTLVASLYDLYSHAVVKNIK